MHDSRESSYYEIALTNRQVVVFFVVLLICVVGAFFSGIWLGQRRAAEAPQVLARAEAAEEPADDADTLQELNFFTEDPGSRPRQRVEPDRQAPAPEAAPPEAAGDADTTFYEDLRDSEPEAVAESEPEITREPEPEPEPAPRREQRAAAESPPPQETGMAESAPAEEPVTPAGPATAEGYVIQVFSSPDGAQARKLLDRLVDGGYEAFLSPVEVEGRTMHRVRIGPLATRQEADALAAKVHEAYQVDTWITRNE